MIVVVFVSVQWRWPNTCLYVNYGFGCGMRVVGCGLWDVVLVADAVITVDVRVVVVAVMAVARDVMVAMDAGVSVAVHADVRSDRCCGYPEVMIGVVLYSVNLSCCVVILLPVGNVWNYNFGNIRYTPYSHM